MLFVAVAAIGALPLTALVFAGLLRSQARAHARREDLLVNQLCALAGKPWQPAPATEHFRQVPAAAKEPVLIANPGQWPDE